MGSSHDDLRMARRRALPPALRDAMARESAVVRESTGVDECRIDILDVQADEHGVVVLRWCWWFDEDLGQWSLDDTSEWYLSHDEAMMLGVSLEQAASLPAMRHASHG